MDHEKFKSINVRNVEAHSLDKTTSSKMSIGSFTVPGGNDTAAFFKEAVPVLGSYIGKGVAIARDAGKNPGLGKRLIKEVYPQIISARSVRDIDPLLNELYQTCPQTRAVIGEIDDTFGTGGGGVQAIPPVIVAGVIVYAIGYAIGYSQS